MSTKDLTFDKKRGLYEREWGIGPVPLGSYQQLSRGAWRRRVKLPDGRHGWQSIELRQLPKRIHVEALLLGVQT